MVISSAYALVIRQAGELRFHENMVRAMFSLARVSSMTRIPPLNCRPRWMALISDKCAPVRACGEFLQWLGKSPGTNRLSSFGYNPKSRSFKTSQWKTLWSVHLCSVLNPRAKKLFRLVSTFDCDVVCMVRLADALSMAKRQEDILKRWRNISGGAPDEIVVASELVARNKSVRTCICAFCA